jgi:hypothetical protein
MNSKRRIKKPEGGDVRAESALHVGIFVEIKRARHRIDVRNWSVVVSSGVWGGGQKYWH